LTRTERFHDSAFLAPGLLAAPPGWQPLRYVLDPERFFAAAHRRHGDIFTLRMLGQRWIVLANHEHVAELFKQPPETLDAGQASRPFRPLIGTSNMLMLDGEDYLHRRRLVLPGFHAQRMSSYEEIVRRIAQEHIATWPLGEPTAIYERLSALVFQIMLRCVFGIQQERQPLVDALRQMMPWITDTRRVLTFFLLGPNHLTRLPRYRAMLARLDRNILAEIELRRACLDLEQREDILSLLVQAHGPDGSGLADRDLRDELITLLFAGHENTTALLAWTMHELARAPLHQDKLAARDERFAAAVLAETLRLRPPVPLLARRLRRPLTLGGYDLPAGSNLCPCALLVHRDPQIYANPWTFDPNRFLEHQPAASEWFPYGAGIRRCIGASFAQLEARIILQEIIDRLRFRPRHMRPEPTKARAIVLVPARDTRLTLFRRPQ
jgi:cytochrome P450